MSCAAAAVLASVAAAASPITDLEWDAAQRFERTLAVGPRAFAELCGRLAAGTRVEWRFESPRPVDFNIHFHVGKDVRYPVQRDRTRVQTGVLEPDSDEDYCWMWSNKSSGLTTVRVVLRRTR